jgi:hypothetical protein
VLICEGNADVNAGGPVGGPYRHTCSILDSPAERLADVATFTQAGLARQERVAKLFDGEPVLLRQDA